MLGNASKAHKAIFERYITAVGTIVTLVFPPARSGDASMSSRVFGAPGYEENDGPTKEITVIWSNGQNSGGVFDDGIDKAPSKVVAALAGNGQVLDAVIRCRLADALIDPTKKQGKTYFHRAKEVEYQGQRFSINGFSLGGLPPEGPYILWVGLSRIDKE